MIMGTHAAPASLALSHDDALVLPGTLLAPDGTLVAPYDIEHGSDRAEGCVPAAAALGLLHAVHRPFRRDYGRTSDVHVINGMGVALGDSVIGLTALAALRTMHPGVRFTLYRPARAPRYVEALYALAADVVAPSRALPYAADALPAHAPCIDLETRQQGLDGERLRHFVTFAVELNGHGHGGHRKQETESRNSVPRPKPDSRYPRISTSTPNGAMRARAPAAGSGRR